MRTDRISQIRQIESNVPSDAGLVSADDERIRGDRALPAAKPVILHVSECYEGGVSRAIQSMVRNMESAEHWLLATGADVAGEAAGVLFARTIELPVSHAARALRIAAVAADRRVLILHAHSSWAGMYVRLVPTSQRVIYQPHGYAFEMASLSKRVAFFLAEKALAMIPNQVHAVLSPRERELARLLNRRISTEMLPNVPSVPLASDVPNRPNGPITITMVGRLCRQKDPSYFLALLERVQAELPGSQGVWIGDGDSNYRAQLEAAGVTVTGWVKHDDLVRELDASAVYVHTAAYEGFPLSVLDAAARNRPIFARGIPAFDGSPVLQYGTLEDHVQAVCAAARSDEKYEEAVSQSMQLMSLMNEEALRQALNQLYRAALDD